MAKNTTEVRREIVKTRERLDDTVRKLQTRLGGGGSGARVEAESALTEVRNRPATLALLAASAILEIVAMRRSQRERGLRGLMLRLKDAVTGLRGRDRRRRMDQLIDVARSLLETAALRADDIFVQMPRIQSLLRTAADAVGERRIPPGSVRFRRRSRALMLASAVLQQAAQAAAERPPRRARTPSRPRLRNGSRRGGSKSRRR
jgi:hypothetical protein